MGKGLTMAEKTAEPGKCVCGGVAVAVSGPYDDDGTPTAEAMVTCCICGRSSHKWDSDQRAINMHDRLVAFAKKAMHVPGCAAIKIEMRRMPHLAAVIHRCDCGRDELLKEAQGDK